jgi:hypothetical protein
MRTPPHPPFSRELPPVCRAPLIRQRVRLSYAMGPRTKRNMGC